MILLRADSSLGKWQLYLGRQFCTTSVKSYLLWRHAHGCKNVYTMLHVLCYNSIIIWNYELFLKKEKQLNSLNHFYDSAKIYFKIKKKKVCGLLIDFVFIHNFLFRHILGLIILLITSLPYTSLAFSFF